MAKVHGTDKVLDPILKPEAQARREGIPKPIPVIPKGVSQPQKITPPVLPKRRQGRAHARWKTIKPQLQPIPQQ